MLLHSCMCKKVSEITIMGIDCHTSYVTIASAFGAAAASASASAAAATSTAAFYCRRCRLRHCSSFVPCCCQFPLESILLSSKLMYEVR